MTETLLLDYVPGATLSTISNEGPDRVQAQV